MMSPFYQLLSHHSPSDGLTHTDRRAVWVFLPNQPTELTNTTFPVPANAKTSQTPLETNIPQPRWLATRLLACLLTVAACLGATQALMAQTCNTNVVTNGTFTGGYAGWSDPSGQWTYWRNTNGGGLQVAVNLSDNNVTEPLSQAVSGIYVNPSGQITLEFDYTSSNCNQCANSVSYGGMDVAFGGVNYARFTATTSSTFSVSALNGAIISTSPALPLAQGSPFTPGPYVHVTMLIPTTSVTPASGTLSFIHRPLGGHDDNWLDNVVIPGVCPDVSVTKTGPATVPPTGSVTYSIVVNNTGSAANGTLVRDPAVANFTASSVTCSGATGGAVCPASPTVAALQNGTLTIPTLPSGGSLIFTVNGTAGSTAGSSIQNVVTVTLPASLTDSAPGNNSATAVTAINATACGSSVLQNFDGLTTATAPSAFYADPIFRQTCNTTYNSIITTRSNTTGGFPNNVPADHTSGSGNFLLNGTPGTCIPPGTVWGTGTVTGGRAPISVVAGRTYTFSAWAANIAQGGVSPAFQLRWSTDGVTWTVMTSQTVSSSSWTQLSGSFVATGGSVYLDVYNTVNSSGGNDFTLDDISLSSSCSADVALVKTGPATVSANGLVSYTLAVSNSGPDAADGALVRDPAVANFTASSVSCAGSTGGAACPSSPSVAALQGGSLVIPSLPSGGSLTLVVTGTAASSGSITNVASVSAPGGVTDTTPGNNSSTAVTTITPTTTVSGNVWNDADGNINLNGSETGTNAGGPLYVNLVNSGGTVISSALVSPTGSYTLTNVPTNTTGLKLVLTNTATGATPDGLPTNWVNTGEKVDPSNPATQSTTLGQIELTTSTGPITAQDFGIEQLPTPGSGSNTVSNPGGTTPVTVPANTFTNTSPSTDTSPGSVTAIQISAFPSNVTSLTINGIPYTPGTFPGDGVTVPTDGNGNPTQPILVDPTNDANPVVIAFLAIDNAGKESTTTGTATINSSLVASVSGTVWNDADGNLTLNGSETGTNTGSTLYVNLVDGSNTVVGSTTVAPDGTYSLTNVPTNITGYKLVLTNSATSSTPGTLPTGWVNTGENAGPGNTAPQSTTLGQIELTVGTSSIAAQNFGIEVLPTSGSGSNTVANAGGTSPVTVPANTFTNTNPSTDTAPGSVTAIHITAFPGNVTSLTVNGTPYTPGSFPAGGVTVPTDGSGNPTVPILIDPINDVNPVVITFVAVDNAGKESTTSGTATVNSLPVITVAGTVWNDADGSLTLNGSETGTNTGSPLYVNLIDGAGTVVGSTTVATNGTYSLANVPTNVTGYKLVLSNSPTSATPGPLPIGWVNTGESIDPSNTATQSTTLGQIELTTGTGNVTAQNFGIEALPTSGNGSNTVANAGGTTPVSVPANTFTNSTPSTDTAPGSVTAIRITTFPANVTSLTINGTTYTPVTFPAGGITVPTDGNGNPTQPISVDPTNDANPAVIAFVAVDNAGKESTTIGTATINSSAVVTVSGQVWNDADGNLTLNGSETGTNAGGPLYVNLVDGMGTVVGSTTVASDGTYSLANVPTNVTGYKLVLTNTASSTAPGGLPTGWVNTGESVDPSNTATQSTTLGQIELTTGTGNVTAQNFGIERLPSAGTGSSTVSNAGGTTPVTVPANTFTNATPSTDTAPGSVTAIRITSFPGNVTSLTINGSVYTPGSFPGAGVVVPTNGSGAPTVTILVDPTNDSNPVAIPFVAIDNAGKESPNTGTATIVAAIVPDLTPIIYARPSTVYKTTNMTVVVDVFELLGIPTSGLITVRVTKDPLLPLIFPTTATMVGGRSVQNSLWTLDNSNPSYYTLTTTSVVPAGDKLSFGFTGQLIPGATTGVLTVSSTILGNSGGEVRVNNNVDADKVDYFQQ